MSKKTLFLSLLCLFALAGEEAKAGDTWKIRKNMILRTNAGRIQGVLIASGFEKGSDLAAKEAGMVNPRGRNMGVALRPVAAPDARTTVFEKGKYPNQSDGGKFNRLQVFPWSQDVVKGKPMMAAFVFASVGHSAAHISHNPPVKLPDMECWKKHEALWPWRKDSAPADCPEKLYPMQPTSYAEGDDKVLVVELPYDVLEDLMSGRLRETVGTVRYYSRAAYQTLLYDVGSLERSSKSRLNAEENLARYLEHEIDVRAAQSLLDNIRAMQSLVSDYAEGHKNWRVAIAVDSDAAKKDTVTLDFAF